MVVAAGSTLVTRTAQALSDLSLAEEQGAYLGAEDELLARLKVSRPTFRQAAKIVESDRLISVRRGLHGGFYAERPNAADSIRALARYLRLNGATLADIIVVTRPVAEAAAALAATRGTEPQRQQLRDFVSRIDEAESRADIVRSETEMGRRLAEMSGNPAVQLFMEIGFTFGIEEQRVGLFDSAANRAEAKAMQRTLCEAVLSGDADVARLMMQRRGQMVAAWLQRIADMADGGVAPA